jgi:hypothetical protein
MQSVGIKAVLRIGAPKNATTKPLTDLIPAKVHILVGAGHDSSYVCLAAILAGKN